MLACGELVLAGPKPISLDASPRGLHPTLRWIVGKSEVNGLRGNVTAERHKWADLREEDFWPTSKSAIKCRIRSAVTQAEAAIALFCQGKYF